MKRTCKKCGVEKDIEEFPKQKYAYACKACRNEQKYEAYKICISCDYCKIFFMTSPAQARNNNHFCTHFCYSLSLKNKLGAYKDLSGKRFGKWTVIKDSGDRKNHSIMWLCKCDCGNYGKIVGGSLKSGNSLSCGCFLALDLIGKRFGRLLVKNRSYTKNNKIFWLCECDCGAIKSIDGDPIRRGATVSCGCLNKELTKKRFDEFRDSRKTMPPEAYRLPYSIRNAKYLTDCYINGLIQQDTKIKRKNIPQSLVNYKREQIKLLRAVKEQEL